MKRQSSGRAAAALIATLAVVGSCGRGQRAARPSAADDAAELRRITQEMMDAIAPGRAEVWRRYLHERVVYVDENGWVLDKAALLRELTPLPPGLIGRIEVDVFRAEASHARAASSSATSAATSAASSTAARERTSAGSGARDVNRPPETGTRNSNGNRSESVHRSVG